MKVPAACNSITSTYELPMLGWGLLTTWGLVGIRLVLPAEDGSPFNLLPMLTTLLSVLCCGLSIVFLRCFPKQIQSLMSSGILLKISGLLMIGGCILNMLDRAYGASVGIQYFSNIAASVGYMLLTLLWCAIYARNDAQVIEQLTVLSVAVCAAVYLIAIIGPEILAAAIWIITPILSTWCLNLCLKNSADTKQIDEADTAYMDVDSNPASPLRTPLLNRNHFVCAIGVLVATFAVTIPRVLLSAQGQASLQLPINTAYAQLSGVVAAIVLVLWCTVYAQRISLSVFFRFLYPLSAVGLLFCAVSTGWLQFFGLCILFATQWVLYVFMWLFATETNRSAGNPVAVFALLRLCFDSGYYISTILASLFVSISASMTTVCFAAMAAFVATILLPLDKDPNQDFQKTPGSNPVPAALRDTAANADLNAAQTCEQRVASRYALSQREQGILSYLLRGYSLPAIRNELYISKGTVDTYVQRIYRKCDVHSRQELIDLVYRDEPANNMVQ
ncbi:MAG: helix-turn-helix transcriptional regulator [Coriobacteriales bacterium]|nr:helix-turn-helix transcriptional regulator [Coriobacteriales bacterium]